MIFARAFTLLIVLVVATPASALDAMGRQDQGWTLGLGFGMGRAHVSYFGGGIEGDLREGANTEWRVGKMLSERLALTFDYQGWMLEDGDLNRLSARLRQGLQVWGPGLTWYPGNPENGWGGMYLRASGGFALANLAITVLDEDLLEVEEERIDEWGWAVGASIGYEFFVTRSVGIGPALNFAYLSIESADADASPDQQIADYGRWMTLTILGTWYFF